VNDLPPIDTCALAIQLGATFVARSFSGDKRQLLTLLKAALAHKGTVMIDVISPCVTFNDHEGSTKSYKYLKDHDEPVQEIGFVPHFENIDVDYDPGTTTLVKMHDGSSLRLRKLEHDYDATNKRAALDLMGASHENGEVLTGVLYLNTNAPSFTDLLNVVDQPLGQLPESMVRPPRKVLDEIMAELQ
jgi:2-oxoglutarate/2-oxoacid ferredoxin oxidoreductase subunit beta